MLQGDKPSTERSIQLKRKYIICIKVKKLFYACLSPIAICMTSWF